jgi:hypothetical protein
MRQFLLLSFGILLGVSVVGQGRVSVAAELAHGDDSVVAMRVVVGLERLLGQAGSGKADTTMVGGPDRNISISVFQDLDSAMLVSGVRLVNMAAIGGGSYRCEVSFVRLDSGLLLGLINFVVYQGDSGVRFGVPLAWLTKEWRRVEVGTVRYHYIGAFDRRAAEEFDLRNRRIASRLGLPPVHLDIYLTRNFQEISTLIGRPYYYQWTGSIRSGLFPDTNAIFAIEGNEDFSHDILHYYSSLFRGKVKRNAAADEGLAYLWGNAYYPDERGRMIPLDSLVSDLREYAAAHRDVSMLDLFLKSPKVLVKRAKEVSVRAVITGVILAEVERKSGVSGIKRVLVCGPGDDAFFGVIKVLLGVDKVDFDSYVRRLIIR